MIDCRNIPELNFKGVSQRTISSSTGHSRNTVSDVVQRAKSLGLEVSVNCPHILIQDVPCDNLHRLITAIGMYHLCHLFYHRVTTNVPENVRRLPLHTFV